MFLPFIVLRVKAFWYAFLLSITTSLCVSATAHYVPFGIGNAAGSDGQPKLFLWLDGSTPTGSALSNVGGMITSGGSVNVDGTRSGGARTSYYTFSFTYPGNLFRWTVEYYDATATRHPDIASLDTTVPFAIKTVSKQEYWRVNSNIAAATNSRVWLSWGENSAVAEEPGDYDKLVVLHWDGGNGVWQNAEANRSTFNYYPINDIGSFISQSAVSFSERFFTLGSTLAANPLPVDWLYFDGTTDGKDHNLTWATASEINNDFFELERSIDGRDFVPIARIEGSGNSNTQLDYSYVDRLAPAGLVYYRIRQVDFNGDYEYSEEIVTLVKEQAGPQPLDFLLYPNPTSIVKARLLISDFNAEMAIISLSELSGKVLLRKAVWIDEQGISDEITCEFPTGVYIVSVLHNGDMRSKPLIINQ